MKKRKNVPVIYVGRRLDAKNRTCRVFLYKGKERWFGAMPGGRNLVIGFVYGAEFDGKNLYMERRPKHHGVAEASETEVQKWEAKDMSVQGFLDERRALAKAKRTESKLGPIAKLLYPIVKDMDYRTRDRFIDVLVRKIAKQGPIRF